MDQALAFDVKLGTGPKHRLVREAFYEFAALDDDTAAQVVEGREFLHYTERLEATIYPLGEGRYAVSLIVWGKR